VPINLNENNVIEYIMFFFSYVRGRHGRFIIIENVDDIDWREEPPPAARKAMSKILAPVSVAGIDDDGTFHLSMFVVFKDSLFIIEDMPVMDDVLGQ
jgi:hypothetical protein